MLFPSCLAQLLYPIGLGSQAPKAFILELEGDLPFVPGKFRLFRFRLLKGFNVRLASKMAATPPGAPMYEADKRTGPGAG